MEAFYNIVKHAHSGTRWLVLIFLVYAVFNAFAKWRSAKTYTSGDKRTDMLAMSFVHLQFVIGIITYFISPKVKFAASSMKDAVDRFFLVEHSVMMLIALILITIGYSKAKRTMDDDRKKFRTVFIFYLLGLLLILFAIPWSAVKYGSSLY